MGGDFLDVFISYARRDAKDAAIDINADLEAGGHNPWYDDKLQGGQTWWDEILDAIASSGAFILLLSPNSVTSKACQAELTYAQTCGRVVVPVLVRDVDLSLFDDATIKTQFVDYRDERAELKLMDVLNSFPPPPTPPDLETLPRPDTPLTNLGPLRDLIKAPQLSEDRQHEIVSQLRQRVEADENDQPHTLLGLMMLLRDRKGIVVEVSDELDQLMAALPRASDDELGPRLSWRSPRVKDADTEGFLETIVDHVDNQQFTPILGMGMTDPLLGSKRQWTRDWARRIQFPLSEYQRDDLPAVAQWRSVNGKGMVSNLDSFLRDRLSIRFPNIDPNLDLGGLLGEAWETERGAVPADPHETLARLDCPLYVVAHPWNLLEKALKQQGKDPVVKVCPWRPDERTRDWKPELTTMEDGFVGTKDQPLVYHIFGSLEEPDSLVITEDDYLEFVAGVSGPNKPIPSYVSSRVKRSALMLLGFGLEDLDIRVLLRSLVGEGSRLMEEFEHVAAQVDVDAAVMEPKRARDYLTKYFNRVSEMKIYWGTVDDFMRDLATMGAGSR